MSKKIVKIRNIKMIYINFTIIIFFFFIKKKKNK